MGKDDGKIPEKKLSEMSDEEIQKALNDAGFQSPFSSSKKQLSNIKPYVPSLPDFNSFTKPLASPVSFDNPPKREIELSEVEENRVKEALNYFETNSLYEAELIKLFDDWQSDRTKSIKKFLLSILTVLSLTVFAGINILEVELFSITVAEGYQYLFLAIFLIVLGSLFCYYEINLQRDKKVNDSNLKVFMKALKRSSQYLGVVDTILKKKRITIEQLVYDFEEVSLVTRQKSSPIRGYKLMKFYKMDLEKPFKTDLNIYRFELTGLYFLGLLSILTILRSMIWVANPEADLVVFYLSGFAFIGVTISLIQLRFNE
jgi:uncharacterized membrane protein